MKLKDVTVINQTGLRARVATIFVSKASEFKGTTVSIRTGERLLNGKSLLGVLSGNITHGTTIQLVTNGPDEETAMNTLVELIESGFEDY
jgi:phosphocarrier protein